MITYQYRGRNEQGAAVEGVIDAESRLAALDLLSRRGFFPTALQTYEEAPPEAAAWLRRIRSKDVSLFTRQMADLLESGVPLPRALALAREQTENIRLAKIIQDILDQVKGGQSLSDALKTCPAIFQPFYTSLIYAGETGGALAGTFGRLADFVEQEEEFRSHIQTALAYPLLISAVGMAAVIFLMVFAVPRLSAMFTDMGQQMPWITRCLLALSRAMTSGWAVFAAALTVGIGITVYRSARRHIRRVLEDAAFRMPVWGSVIRKSMMVRFARTLAALLAGGVPIVEALRVVADVFDQEALKGQILKAAGQVEQGESLAGGLRAMPDFPVFVCHMIAVGEEVNTLEKSLTKIAATYERETDRAMKLAASLLEPVMILVIGSIVGLIVIAMLLPIFQVSVFVK